MQPGFTGSAAMPQLTLVQDLRRLRLHELGRVATAAKRRADAAERPVCQQPGLARLSAAGRALLSRQGLCRRHRRRSRPRQGPLDNLAFSQQVLKGMALAASQALPEAEQQWRALLASQPTPLAGSAAAAGSAMTLERAGRLEQVFAREPHPERSLRIPLLEYVAPAPLLRRMVQDEQASDTLQRAGHTLRYKQLTHGDYRGFLQDLALAPLAAPFDWQGSQEYQCPRSRRWSPPWRTTPNPQGAQLPRRVFPEPGAGLGSAPAAVGCRHPGGQPGSVAGQQRSRLDWYQQVIANPKAAKEGEGLRPLPRHQLLRPERQQQLRQPRDPLSASARAGSTPSNASTERASGPSSSNITGDAGAAGRRGQRRRRGEPLPVLAVGRGQAPAGAATGRAALSASGEIGPLDARQPVRFQGQGIAPSKLPVKALARLPGGTTRLG